MTGQTSAQMALRDPDIRLMLLVREADDRSAFAELVGRYQHRLVAVMNHLVGHPDEAEDLAQEVFLRVYRTRQKYSPKAKFATWLFTIANNLALNSLRDRRRKTTVPLDSSDPAASSSWQVGQLAASRDQPPTHNLQQVELATVIRRALDQLNDRQRMAVVLNKFEDLNYAEIAEVMGLSAKAVKSLLSRARSRLRECLQPYVYMDGQTPPDPEREDGGE
jgi:RNA polymerase sigma-70 factor (ECF subfamily)